MRRVTAAVVIEEGRLLLTRRSPDQALAGLWELPGGKIEEGESPQSCLERELIEELGMPSTAGQVVASVVYRYEHGEFELFALSTERHGDYELRVHDAATWILPDQVGQLALAPADVALITQLRLNGVW